MPESDHNLRAVVKTRTVALDRAEAFRLFVDELGAWWPMSTHSVSQSASAVVAFDGKVLVETAPGGERHEWAEVIARDVDERIVLAWHPGGPSIPASQLDVRFADSGDGTELRIRHSGWERYGAEGAQRRRDYHLGWEIVLDAFLEAAAARAS